MGLVAATNPGPKVGKGDSCRYIGVVLILLTIPNFTFLGLQVLKKKLKNWFCLLIIL